VEWLYIPSRGKFYNLDAQWFFEEASGIYFSVQDQRYFEFAGDASDPPFVEMSAQGRYAAAGSSRSAERVSLSVQSSPSRDRVQQPYAQPYAQQNLQQNVQQNLQQERTSPPHTEGLWRSEVEQLLQAHSEADGISGLRTRVEQVEQLERPPHVTSIHQQHQQHQRHHQQRSPVSGALVQEAAPVGFKMFLGGKIKNNTRPVLQMAAAMDSHEEDSVFTGNGGGVRMRGAGAALSSHVPDAIRTTIPVNTETFAKWGSVRNELRESDFDIAPKETVVEGVGWDGRAGAGGRSGYYRDGRNHNHDRNCARGGKGGGIPGGSMGGHLMHLSGYKHGEGLGARRDGTLEAPQARGNAGAAGLGAAPLRAPGETYKEGVNRSRDARFAAASVGGVGGGPGGGGGGEGGVSVSDSVSGSGRGKSVNLPAWMTHPAAINNPR
jgi:hypothetical protein